MSISIYSLENKKIEDITLPKIFGTPYRPDVIKKAVIHQQSNSFQPQGRDPMAGKRTTAESQGVGHGAARVPRLKGSSRAAFGVSIVGGHRAFPPKSEKVIKKAINKKEKRLAISSGIAATAKRDVIASRGHNVSSVSQFPLIIVDDFQALKKTKEVKDVLISIGLWPDVERAKRKKIRAGRGKMRGRKYKRGVGPLIVVSEDHGIIKAASNIPGVDVVTVKNLNAELLAPGTHAGRLVLWSKSAISMLDNIWGGLDK